MKRLSCLMLLACGIAWPQGSVTIFGNVTDNSGAVVLGARITVTNAETGLARTAASDATGNYVVSQLPIGRYSLKAEMQGFKTYLQENIAVQVDENRQVNITLEVGSLTESINVAAEITQVETRSGALREVVDSARIVELPLNGRNPLQLQYLVAGSGGRAGQDQAQNESVSINGARTNANNYSLDGGDNHDPYFNTPAIFPTPDALQEFSIQTNSYGAERGRNAGAYMNAVTKSGTNNFHGSAFEFLRNEKLNARNFFANNVPPFKRNQFGGTFGGPVRRDKTFFFGSYQRTTQRSAPGSVTATVLTEQQRRGDFSALGKALKDPLGGNFPGAVIPASRLHPASQKFLEAFIPLPNRPNGLVSFASQEKLDDDQVLGKIDHQLTGANQVSGRLLYNFNKRDEVTGNMPGFFAAIEYRNWSAAVTDTHIFSPTVLNTFNFSYNDITRRQLSIVPGNKSWNDFGAKFTRTFTADAPVGMHTTLDGYFNAFSRFPLNHFRKNIQFSEMLSWNRGAHFIKIGGDVRRSILNLQEFFRGDPYMRFRNTYTGDAAADFLLGRPTQIEQIAEDSNRPRTTEMDAFIQDDWKVSSRLTLNLGFRWDPYMPFIDQTDKFSQMRLGVQSKLFPNAPAGVVFAGDPGYPRGLVKRRLGEFAPRIGFAIDPFGDGKSSIRGGYGIFYSQIRQQAHNQISNNQPFAIKLTIDNPPGGIDNPYIETGNPFPFEPPQSSEAKAKYKFLLPMSMQQWNINFRNAIVQQWNLNLQRQFASAYVATVAYVGSKGNHLYLTNELNPAIYGRTGNTNQRRLYYPTFSTVTDQTAQGNSTYHSMQLTLNKRMSQGVTIQSNYTWSKLLDDASSDGSTPANPFDIGAQKGLSDFDIAHRFVTSFIWEMPRLKGARPLVRHVLGGWETNGIITLQSGRPFTIVSGKDNSGSAVNNDRADLVGNPYLDTGRPRGELVERYFNTAAFTANALGTFGNVGRNTMRAPGDATVDFGVIKDFFLTEQSRVQYRLETFNLFNRVNLNAPAANQSANTFGKITGAGSPRVIQMALKYVF